MPLEIRVRAVPDVQGFKDALQKAADSIKVPVGATTGSARGSSSASGSASASSTAANISAVTNEMKSQLAIQKQLTSLAQKADNLRLRGGNQFKSENLTKLEQFLATVRNADGSFKTITGDMDAFNKQLSEAATNSTRATAEFSKWQTQVRAENSIVSERAKLYDQLNTAVRRFNSAEQLEKQGFSSDTLNKYRDQMKQYVTKTGALKFDKGDIVDYASEVRELAQAFRTVNTEASAFTSRKTTERSLKAEATSLKNLSRQINDYMSANANLINNRTGYSRLQKLVQNIDLGKIDGSKARNEFASIRAEMKAMGLESETLGQRIQKLFGDHFNTAVALAALNALRLGLQQVVTSVRDVDTAMTELKKVASETDSGYEAFLDQAAERAQKLGTSLSNVINSTAEAVKLGYDIEDATPLSDAISVYMNVGDNVESVDEATSAIVSGMKAFNIEAEDSINIVDKLNETANRTSASSGGLGEALQRSAAALSAAGNTIDETIGLIVAADDIQRNPLVTGTALKTVSMRLRSSKVELEEMGEDSEGAAESVSKLREQLLALTGVDIMLDEDERQTVLAKPAQIGKHPAVGNSEGKACIENRIEITVAYFETTIPYKHKTTWLG